MDNTPEQKEKTGEERAREIFELVKNRLPKPYYVRTNNFKRMYGINYIIKRNEFGSAVYVVGKAYRKLQTKVEIENALKEDKLVAQWGNRFFLYSRITPEFGIPILEEIWSLEVKRGIAIPEVSDYAKESFEI